MGTDGACGLLFSETLTELVSKHYLLTRFLGIAFLALAGKPQSTLLVFQETP